MEVDQCIVSKMLFPGNNSPFLQLVCHLMKLDIMGAKCHCEQSTPKIYGPLVMCIKKLELLRRMYLGFKMIFLLADVL